MPMEESFIVRACKMLLRSILLATPVYFGGDQVLLNGYPHHYCHSVHTVGTCPFERPSLRRSLWVIVNWTSQPRVPCGREKQLINSQVRLSLGHVCTHTKYTACVPSQGLVETPANQARISRGPSCTIQLFPAIRRIVFAYFDDHQVAVKRREDRGKSGK